MALEPAPAFVWGAGGAQMTPDQIAAQRKVAQAMMAQGMDYSPVQSPWQGVARVAQAMMGGLEAGQADAAAKTNQKAESDLLANIFGGGASAATTPTAPTATASVSTPMGATSIPAGKDEFVNTVMPLAQEASAKTGIDPRIIVAQAALESGWGKSAPGNNLFGIKSHGQTGGNMLPTTEVVNGQPVQTTDSFRAYASPADSVSGYADFMMTNPRYAPVRSAQGLDAQIAALGQSGYATDPNYAAKVGSIAKSLPGPAAPQVVENGEQSSPLDTAQYPAGPVGAPGAQMAQAAPQPSAAPQAVPATPQAAPGVNPALLRAMSSPYVSDGTKKILGLVLSQQMEAAKNASDPLRRAQLIEAQGKIEAMPLDRRAKELTNMKLERELQGEGATPLSPEERASFGIPEGQAAYKTRRGEIKFGPAGMKVTTNVGSEAPDGALRKKLDEGTAKNWSAWQEAGHVSAGQVQDLQMLDELIKVAPQGPLTGRLAEMFPGFSSGGDAFNAIVKRVAPTMRAPGSGSTSDIEYDGMLRSLPALRNKPEANVAISEMMKSKAAINIERADIISQYSQNQISRNDAEKKLGELNRRSIMTPAMRQMLAGLGGKDPDVLPGDVVDGYRFKGGNKADKSAWEKVQ